MTAFYLKSGAGATEFAQSTAYSLGDKIVPKRSDAGSNYTVARKWVWECTTAGTSAAAEPTWGASVTVDVTTVVSGTATFTARRPGHSTSGNEDWSFATIYLDYAISCPVTAGDIVYVSNNHAESQGAAYSASALITGVSIVCVDDGAAPPTTVATTATITTTAGGIIIGGGAGREYIYGLNFISGFGSAAGANVTANLITAELCTFQVATTQTSANFTSVGLFINCSIKFAAAGQYVHCGSRSIFLGGNLLSGGVSPTNFVGLSSAYTVFDGFDFSNADAAMNLSSASGTGFLQFMNCKLPASWSGVVNVSSPGGPVAGAFVMNCSNSGNAYSLTGETHRGTIDHESTVVKTGGFAVAGTPVSWKMVGASTCGPGGCYINALYTPELAAYNATTGSAITVTVDILRDSLTNLQDNEIWLEVTYLGASGAPLSTYVSSRPATPLTAASDCAASSATWTTTGLTNPNEQKLSVTFTPQMAGMVIGRVKLCKASATVYVDPVLQVS